MSLSVDLVQPSKLAKTRASFIDTLEGVGPPESRRRLVWTLFSIFALVLVTSAMRFAGWPSANLKGLVTDFHDFYLAGLLVHTGELGRAYHLADLLAFQKSTFGDVGMLPWTYPPPFDLVVGALAYLPIGFAYLVFVGSTFVAYFAALRRLTPERWFAVTLLLAPVFIVTLRCGQNGFLTGALMASAAVALSERWALAGVPLGLMLIKPHLAVTFLLYALLTRRWGTLAVAAVVATLACLAASLALGPAIWTAFFGGVREAAEFLAHGFYPNYRMVSVYAMVRSFHLSAAIGAVAQGVVGAIALLATALAALRLPPRPAVAVAALAALMVSPYAYDYDLPIFGIGLALNLPLWRRFIGVRWRVALYAFLLATQGLGLGLSVASDAHPGLVFLPSLGALSLQGALILTGIAYYRAWPMRRPERST